MSLLFVALSQVRGRHWQLDQTQARHVGESLGAVWRHVPMPQAQRSILTDVLALVAALAAVVLPRLVIDQAVDRQAAAMPRPSSPTDAAPAPQPGNGYQVEPTWDQHLANLQSHPARQAGGFGA